MEIRNICMTKNFDIADAEKVPITQNWLGKEGFHFTETCNYRRERNIQKQH